MDRVDMSKPVKGAFNLIKPPYNPQSERAYLGKGYWADQNKPQDNYEGVNTFVVGQGSTAIKMDEQGLSLGGNKFSQAPIRMSPTGTMIYNDGNTDRILIGELE